MKVSIFKKVGVEAKTIHVKAGVRYWKDASVNGVEDTMEKYSLDKKKVYSRVHHYKKQFGMTQQPNDVMKQADDELREPRDTQTYENNDNEEVKQADEELLDSDDGDDNLSLPNN